MRDTFVILGYGSLIWDLDDLAPHVELPWYMHAGPAMPMEFSRISPKRKMGLVVVLDAEHGEPCATHAVRSRKEDIHAVADDLKARERATDLKYIGAVCRRSGFERSHDPRIAELVRRVETERPQEVILATGTNVEGELETILEVVSRIHEVLHAEGVPRLSTAIKLGTRTDKQPDLASKLR